MRNLGLAFVALALVSACVSQSGRPDMEPPKDESYAAIRSDAMSRLPYCSDSAECLTLLKRARVWAATTDFKPGDIDTKKLTFRMYPTHPKSFLEDDTTQMYVAIASLEDNRKYLQLRFKCAGEYADCGYVEAMRLALYKFVADSQPK